MKILLSLHHASQVSMITAVANHNNSLMSIGFYYGSYETLPPLSNPLCVPMNKRQEISSQGSYTSQPALNRRKRIHMYPCRNIKNVHRQGHKTSRRALGCPEGDSLPAVNRQPVRISRTKPKRHAMHPICPLILGCQLAASCHRIAL